MTQAELLKTLVERWVQRRTARGLKPGTVKHANAQLEFFIGAMTIAEAMGTPAFNGGALLLLSVGRDCTELLPKESK